MELLFGDDYGADVWGYLWTWYLRASMKLVFGASGGALAEASPPSFPGQEHQPGAGPYGGSLTPAGPNPGNTGQG